MVKKILLFLVFSSSLFLWKIVFADVEIYSLMPNTSDDKKLEYIEIINNNSEKIDLSWYKLEDKSWTNFVIKNLILESKKTHKFYYNTTKIRLNNSKEVVKLYDDKNKLIDKVEYSSSQKDKKIIIKNLEKKVFVIKKIEEDDSINENNFFWGNKDEKVIIFTLFFCLLIFSLTYFFIIKKLVRD